jgi:hypothetical protein
VQGATSYFTPVVPGVTFGAPVVQDRRGGVPASTKWPRTDTSAIEALHPRPELHRLETSTLSQGLRGGPCPLSSTNLGPLVASALSPDHLGGETRSCVHGGEKFQDPWRAFQDWPKCSDGKSPRTIFLRSAFG